MVTEMPILGVVTRCLKLIVLSQEASLTNLLLALIYLAFISLGLPDSLLGSAWPEIYPDFAVPVSYAGFISMIISLGTVTSSLLSDRIISRLGTGKVTVLSGLLTALAILGFAFAPNFWALCICAIPYGLGAGSVDVALNNYVALHFKSTHMNWLHCSWGVGATIGPYVMGVALSGGGNWQSGYWYIALIQLVITAILFLSLPLWKRHEQESSPASSEKLPELDSSAANQRPLKLSQTVRVKGVKEVMACFFCYAVLEQATGVWGGTYLKLFKGMDAASAASLAGMLFLGITLGRAASGFLSIRYSDQQLIRLGISLVAGGVVLLLIPGSATITICGLMAIGLGCSPMYPAMIHATPQIFGRDRSRAVIGVQMASCNLGVFVMPPLFGLIAQHLSVGLLPIYLSLALGVFILMQYRMSHQVAR